MLACILATAAIDKQPHDANIRMLQTWGNSVQSNRGVIPFPESLLFPTQNTYILSRSKKVVLMINNSCLDFCLCFIICLQVQKSLIILQSCKC